MKKISALILSLLMILSFAACSSSPSDDGGFAAIDPSELPSKVDLRDYDGKNYVTPVKLQMFGDCWSFSLAGAAEITYLFANDLGVPAGEVNENVDFSEKYISWYMFHGVTKDDVVTGKVRASQVGEGFDLSEAEKTNEIAAYIIGGPNIHNANLFGAGFGPVDESVTVKGETPYAYDDGWTEEWQLPLNASYRSAPVTGHLISSCELPNPASSDANGNYQLNEEGLTAIKNELYQGHGVSLGLRSMHPGFDQKNKTAYYDGDESADHAVTVVGYDDDFPKEKFTVKSSEKDSEDSVPPGDGAFIIKNSWGLSDFDNGLDDGYFYLSYYDHSIESPLSYTFGKTDTDYAALHYDQFDLMMTQWYGSTDHDSETKTANVFDAQEDETLCQIEYRTAAPKTEVSYEIYKNVKKDEPTFGTLLEKGVNRHVYAGAYTIDLKDRYPMKKGEKYSVVLTMKRETDEDGGTVYTEVFPYSTEFFDGMTVHGVINAGESYLYTDGTWTDMATLKDDLIESAYRQCVEKLGARKEELRISMDSKDTFAVDNYPIKALLIPAG